MSLSKPTIVIFDMDGTTVRHVDPRILHVLEWMDDVSFKFYRFWGQVFRRGDKAKATIYKTLDDYKARKMPKLLVHRALHRVRRKSVEQIVEPCPGIFAVLDFLKSRNIPIGLASNGLGKGYGHDILQKFGLEGFFECTMFREDIRHSKPNPESILVTLQHMKRPVTAEDVVWYIGDRHKDITAAQSAQRHLPCTVVPIAYAFNAAIAVLEKNIGPDHIIMSYYDMYDILSRLMESQK